MNKGDLMTRIFQVQRGQWAAEYPLQTYSSVVLGQYQEWEITEDQRKVLEYIRDVFLHGYPDRTGKDSISSMPAFFHNHWRLDKEHWIIQETKTSHCINSGTLQHSNFQAHVMRSCMQSVATEVPIFDETCHGHIDNIYFDGDLIVIGDLKPNAAAEKKAACQLIRYGEILAKNLDIPHEHIFLLYHDDRHCFVSSFAQV